MNEAGIFKQFEVKDLSGAVKKKVSSGEWENIPPGIKIPRQPKKKQDGVESSSNVSLSVASNNGSKERKKQPDIYPGDTYASDPNVLQRGDEPDIEVKYVSDGVNGEREVGFFEKGKKNITVRPAEKVGEILERSGLSAKISGKKERNRSKAEREFEVYGRGLLLDMERVEVSSLGREGNSEEDNWALQLHFHMEKQVLRELVEAYERKISAGKDTSSDLQAMRDFFQHLPEEFVSYKKLAEIAVYEGRTYVHRDSLRGREEKERRERLERKAKRDAERNERMNGNSGKKQLNMRQRTVVADASHFPEGGFVSERNGLSIADYERIQSVISGEGSTKPLTSKKEEVFPAAEVIPKIEEEEKKIPQAIQDAFEQFWKFFLLRVQGDELKLAKVLLSEESLSKTAETFSRKIFELLGSKEGISLEKMKVLSLQWLSEKRDSKK